MPKMGVDRKLLDVPRCIDDMRRFQTQVYPRVQQAGLR